MLGILDFKGLEILHSQLLFLEHNLAVHGIFGDISFPDEMRFHAVLKMGIISSSGKQ